MPDASGPLVWGDGERMWERLREIPLFPLGSSAASLSAISLFAGISFQVAGTHPFRAKRGANRQDIGGRSVWARRRPRRASAGW
jgi:hypothetical protein